MEKAGTVGKEGGCHVTPELRYEKVSELEKKSDGNGWNGTR